MLNPKMIIAWLAGKVNGMRRSRLKTLADIVAAAMRRVGSEEPLYLVTNREDSPGEVVALYLQRMRIEAMFRDLKSRKWGLGIAGVRLSEPVRHDRHFLVLFLAYFFHVAFGAVAEARGVSRLLKPNTVAGRVLSLATSGFPAMRKLRCSINTAVKHLRLGQRRIKTGDC